MNENITENCNFIETEKETLTLTTDDGREVLCRIIRIFHTPESDYIVLLPDDDSTDGSGYLFRFAILPDGSPELSNIETDEEYEHASLIFNRLNESFRLEEDE